MTISVESYSLPGAGELPPNKLLWAPDRTRAVLLIHDMQQYFLRFYPADRAPMVDAMRNIQAVLTACRTHGIPVVYSAQPGSPDAADRKLLGDLWGPGLTACPEQAGIVPALLPDACDLVLAKTRYSAFHATELRDFMSARGRDQLWICGVYAHIGVMLTAFDAFMNDIQPFVVMDAVMDFSRAYHDLAGRLVSERCGVLITAADVLRVLREGCEASDAERATRAALSQLVSLSDGEDRPETSLRDLGLDSVRMMELLETLRGGGLLVESVDLLECQTLSQLYQVVRGAPWQELGARAASGPKS